MADKKISEMTDADKQAAEPAVLPSALAEEEPKEEAKGKSGKKLAVRLRSDYWDASGERHSAAYVDKNGEKRETGAIIELPAEEARALVKSGAAERGDDY